MRRRMGRAGYAFIAGIVVIGAFMCDVPRVSAAPAGPSYLEGALNADKADGAGHAAEPIKITRVLGRMVLSLALVIGLIFLFAYGAKKFISVAPLAKKNGLVQIVDITYLSPKKMICVVDIAGEILVLGSDANSINLLSKIEDVQAKKIILSHGVQAGAKGRFAKALDGYLHGGKTQDGRAPEPGDTASPASIQQCVKDLQAHITKIKKISDDV
jgi:flagellar biosynthetic protein FliO